MLVMERDYKTGVKDNIKVFSGVEIEHTPAYGKQTLFLARNDLTFDQIQELAVLSNAEAIYYGANKSYMHNNFQQVLQVIKFLEHGYYVTVDYPFELHQLVGKKFALCWKNSKFIPFCSIIMPESEEDTSLCFKIDDIEFNKTNPGIWTMSMKDFKEKAGYTKWNDYKKDKPIEENKIWSMR